MKSCDQVLSHLALPSNQGTNIVADGSFVQQYGKMEDLNFISWKIIWIPKDMSLSPRGSSTVAKFGWSDPLGLLVLMEDNALQLHATETRSLIPSKIARAPEIYIVACLLVLRTSILLKTSGAFGSSLRKSVRPIEMTSSDLWSFCVKPNRI